MHNIYYHFYSNFVHCPWELTLFTLKGSKFCWLCKLEKLKSKPYSCNKSWSFRLYSLFKFCCELGILPFCFTLWFSYVYRGLVILRGTWLLLLPDREGDDLDVSGSKSSRSDVESNRMRSSVSSFCWNYIQQHYGTFC